MKHLAKTRLRRLATTAAVVAGGLLLRTTGPGPELAAGVTDPVTGERIGELIYGITPGRYLDTRNSATVDGQNSGVGFLTPGQGAYTLPLRGRSAIPTGATGALLNVTAVDPSATGYLTVWPEGGRPNTSNVNFTKGQTTANLVFVAFGSDGSIQIAISDANAHVLVDVVAFTSDLPTF